MPSSPRSIAGVPSSRALPGFPITASPPVCVLTVIGALAVWRQNKTKNKIKEKRGHEKRGHNKQTNKQTSQQSCAYTGNVWRHMLLVLVLVQDVYAGRLVYTSVLFCPASLSDRGLIVFQIVRRYSLVTRCISIHLLRACDMNECCIYGA